MLSKFLDVVGRYAGKKAMMFICGVAAELIVLAFGTDPAWLPHQVELFDTALMFIPILVAGCAIGQGLADFGQKMPDAKRGEAGT